MSHERGRKIVLTSAAGLAQRAAQALTALVTIPLVIGHLGIVGFGVWAAATSLAWVSGMLDLGIASALVTLIPQAVASGNLHRVRDSVAAAMVGGSCVAIALLTIVGCALALVGATPDRLPFVVAGGALALNIPLSISGRIWLGLQKGYVASFWEFCQTILTLVLLLLFVAQGLGILWLVAAVYGAMLLANAGCLTHVLVSHPWLRPRAAPSLIAFRQVFTSGGLMFLIAVASTSAYAFDNTLTLAWLGPAASAQMAIAMRICATGSGALVVISHAFWPAFAEAAAGGDTSWMRRTLRIGLATNASLALLGSAAIVSLGGPMLHWWIHEDLHIDHTMLWAVAGWIVFMSLPQIPGYAVLAVSRLRAALIITTAATAASLSLKFVLAREWGVIGILIASPILSFAVILPATLWLVWSWRFDRKADARA